VIVVQEINLMKASCVKKKTILMQLYDFFYNYIFRVFTLILSIHLSIEHYLNIVSSYTEKAKTPKSKLKWIGLG